MNAEITKAVVPFQGVIQPVSSVGNKITNQGNGLNRYHEKMLSSGFRPPRGNNSYGRFGKRLENQFALGMNVDIYI